MYGCSDTTCAETRPVAHDTAATAGRHMFAFSPSKRRVVNSPDLCKNKPCTITRNTRERKRWCGFKIHRRQLAVPHAHCAAAHDTSRRATRRRGITSSMTCCGVGKFMIV